MKLIALIWKDVECYRGGNEIHVVQILTAKILFQLAK